MRRLVLVLVVLVASSGAAQAQFLFYQFPVFVETEVWKEVPFEGPLAYRMGGQEYWYFEGIHYRTDSDQPVQCTGQRFVEPFNSAGCRIVKEGPNYYPFGTEYTIQVGHKTHAIVNGKSHFATWVQGADGTIRQLWVRIEEPMQEEAPVIFEAPAAPYEQVLPGLQIPPVPPVPQTPTPDPSFK